MLPGIDLRCFLRNPCCTLHLSSIAALSKMTCMILAYILSKLSHSACCSYCARRYLPEWFYGVSLRQQSAYIRQFNFILAVYGAGVTSLLLAAPGTTLLSLQVAVRFAGHSNDVICTILLRSLRSHIHPQPSDTLLDYSFFPVHLMMARHVGVQCAALVII